MSTTPVKAILGTMTMGDQVLLAPATKMVDAFVAWHAENNREGTPELDTALLYCGGHTEELLGDMLSADDGQRRAQTAVAIKVNPWYDGGLAKENVLKQAKVSLASLQTDSVDTLYLHAPDQNVLITETLEAIDELYTQGVFSRFGLSNYHASDVRKIHAIQAEKQGAIVPTVYQAMYNAVTREIEAELIPTLRELDIALYVYNPIAGGVLSGKHTYDAEPEQGTRFNNSKNASMYRDRFWKKELFDSLADVATACDASNITMVDAAFRWLSNHSLLDASKGDGIVLGASKQEHLDQNLACLTNTDPLDDAVLAAFDASWDVVKDNVASYYRGYAGENVQDA